MAEPFELQDDWELYLYAVVLDQLARQKEAVFSAEMFAAGYWDKEYTIMAQAFAPIVEEIMVGGIRFSTPENLIENVADLFENQRIYAEQHAAEFIKNINENTQANVNNLIQQSITEGWDIDRLAEEINILKDDSGTLVFGEVRARKIAISETTDAFMGGAELSLNELKGQGLNIVPRWLTAADDRVCVICAPRHMKLRGDGWTDMRKAHVGCRCNVALEEIAI